MREGWEMKKLGDVYDVRDGTHDSPKYQESGYPLITSKNLKEGKINYNKIKYISEVDYVNINKRSKVDVGDVLFAMIGTIGNPVVIVEEPKYSIKNVALFKVDSSQNGIYLKYYLESKFVIDKMGKEAKGTTQKFVGLGYLRKFPIPIPPLPEQKQIVTLLDQAFTAIDQAKANVEKNLQNAKELFQSKLNEIFSRKGDGWEEKVITDVVDENCKLSYGIVQPGDEFPNGLPVVRPTNLKTKYIRKAGLKLINPQFAESYQRTSLIGNELLLCVRGSTGVISIATDELKGANVTRGIVPISFNENILNNRFGYYQLISKPIQDIIKEKTYGTALMQINIRDLRKIIMVVPAIDVQKSIIKELDSFSKYMERIEINYNQKINDIEELKKSILQKAFSGELTAKEIPA